MVAGSPWAGGPHDVGSLSKRLWDAEAPAAPRPDPRCRGSPCALEVCADSRRARRRNCPAATEIVSPAPGVPTSSGYQCRRCRSARSSCSLPWFERPASRCSYTTGDRRLTPGDSVDAAAAHTGRGRREAGGQHSGAADRLVAPAQTAPRGPGAGVGDRNGPRSGRAAISGEAADPAGAAVLRGEHADGGGDQQHEQRRQVRQGRDHGAHRDDDHAQGVCLFGKSGVRRCATPRARFGRQCRAAPDPRRRGGPGAGDR